MANALTATDATAGRRCSRHPIQCNESQRIGSNAPSSGDNVCINDKFHRALWTLRYGELIEYKEKHGDCNVPETYEANKPLGTWVQYQRQQYRHLQEGKYSTMTEGRMDKLKELGFIWRKANSSSWNQKYDELKKYKQKHGDCNVPRHNKSFTQLGNWVYSQRTQYRYLQQGRQSSMTTERIDKLEELGFVWSKVDDHSWHQRYKELIEYKETHGHFSVSTLDKTKKQLGLWILTQRRQYSLLQQGKKSHMTTERIEKLEKVGFIWKKRSQK